jgi:hypothetical protein
MFFAGESSMKIIKKPLLFMLNAIIDLLPAQALGRAFYKIMERIEKKDKIFMTFHRRPKYSDAYGLWPDRLRNSKSFHVVMQGPIIKEDNFTLETIRFYKKIFKGSNIILSTWEGEDKEYIGLIKDEKIEVLLNKEPGVSGTKNVNYQIVSSYAGIKKAKELGAHYVLKTRTDQRIYEITCREFLSNLIEFLPAVKGYRQNKRIISISNSMFKYRLSGPSDMLLFGDIDDMFLFWSADLDNRAMSLEQFKSIYGTITTVREEHGLNYPEVYLLDQFLKKIGKDISGGIEDNWKMISEHFCIIDIDIYWYKYMRQIEHKYLRYDAVKYSMPFTFKEWFNLYFGMDNKLHIPEEILDRGIGESIRDT